MIYSARSIVTQFFLSVRSVGFLKVGKDVWMDTSYVELMITTAEGWYVDQHVAFISHMSMMC